MFPVETISAKMLDYYVERSDAIIIDLRDPASYKKGHVRNAETFHTMSWKNILRKNRIRGTSFQKIKF